MPPCHHKLHNKSCFIFPFLRCGDTVVRQVDQNWRCDQSPTFWQLHDPHPRQPGTDPEEQPLPPEDQTLLLPVPPRTCPWPSVQSPGPLRSSLQSFPLTLHQSPNGRGRVPTVVQFKSLVSLYLPHLSLPCLPGSASPVVTLRHPGLLPPNRAMPSQLWSLEPLLTTWGTSLLLPLAPLLSPCSSKMSSLATT